MSEGEIDKKKLIEDVQAWLAKYESIESTYLEDTELFNQPHIVLKEESLVGDKLLNLYHNYVPRPGSGHGFKDISPEQLQKSFPLKEVAPVSSSGASVEKAKKKQPKPPPLPSKPKGKKRARSDTTTTDDGLPPEAKKFKNILLEAVDSMIKISWPGKLKKLAEPFKTSGFLHGNPFACPLSPNSGWVPDVYFEQIAEPIDLLTIKNRVKEGFYLEINSFAHDCRLVVSNSMKFNSDPKDPMHKLTLHLTTVIEASLNAASLQMAMIK